ncbi:MAG: FMN-binding protein MioC [Algicola sp.]|nr:FMN-binding protein MioC [Algicola sp.]
MFQIIVGSQMGAAEYVADELAEALQALGHQAVVHEHPQYDKIPQQDVYWLICTSTHGAGDLPDNIQPFIAALKESAPILADLKYGVIALGDRSYDTFCQAGHQIDQILTSLGAQRSAQLLEIDVKNAVSPEDQALEWLPTWLKSTL